MKRRSLLGFLLSAAVAVTAAAGFAGADRASSVEIWVLDAATGEPLPARLTLLDGKDGLVPMQPAKVPYLAYRPGVLYTGTGEAYFKVAPGKYTLYATRGLEYGLIRRELHVRPGTTAHETLRLAREVKTDGYVACDTHIHTLTHSGHGDATIQERMATIAGEGIELAVATDHNHHVDYAPHAQATGTAPHFTPVIGNEVTTKNGHFNAFPIRPGSAVPDYQSTDWGVLLRGMRAVPGVRVVTLNHPADNHSNFTPTDPRRFHPASGESRDGSPWTFDGFEVVTSAALQSDMFRTYRDWFALLNRGLRISGIGSSDTHDVDRFILGQGRTYIASSATRPDQIDIQQACDSILAGKVLASMGLLTEMWVGEAGVGETTTVTESTIPVRVRVQAPRWIEADRLELFANGRKIVSRPLLPAQGEVVKADLTLRIPRPAHDVWLVAIATGPGVDRPYWPIPRPYQPDRAEWDPRVIGSTNPIRIDADGDGRYSSPHDYARQAVEGTGADPVKLMAALKGFDEATAVQAACICREKGQDLNAAPFRRAIDAADPAIRHGFVAYRNLLRH